MLLVSLVVFLPIGVSVLRAGVELPSAAQSMRLAASLLSDGDEGFDCLVREQEESDEIDRSFQEELFDAAGKEAVRFARDEGVCSFECNGQPEEVFEALSDEMRKKGWFSFSSQQPLCATFMKDHGSYTWALLSCGEVGGKTVVLCCTSGERER